MTTQITPEIIKTNSTTSPTGRMEIRLETQDDAVIFQLRQTLIQMGMTDIVSTKMKTSIRGHKLPAVTLVYYSM